MEGLDEILRIYSRRLQGTPEGFKRYLIDKINSSLIFPVPKRPWQ